jgi:flagellar biosynthesis protein FliQ
LPFYLTLFQYALRVEFSQVMPIVMIMLAVGLTTGIIQAALQIEDTTFSLIPKLIAMIALGLTGGFGALTGFEHLAVMFISRAPTYIAHPWS